MTVEASNVLKPKMLSACVMLVVPVREKPAPMTRKGLGSAAGRAAGDGAERKASKMVRTLSPLLALAPHVVRRSRSALRVAISVVLYKQQCVKNVDPHLIRVQSGFVLGTVWFSSLWFKIPLEPVVPFAPPASTLDAPPWRP